MIESVIESVIASHTRREVTVLVCESGRRWCDAARRFIGPFQHAPAIADRHRPHHPASPLFHVQPVELEKARAAVQGKRAAVILWEVTPSRAAATATVIAQIGVARPDVLQLIGFHHRHVAELRHLGLQYTEFGVRAIAVQPEDLATIARLVHRRFADDDR